ncbi:MAG: hypothetical protein ACLQPV_11440 [Vulcanimicrobiaceae bacterium]
MFEDRSSHFGKNPHDRFYVFGVTNIHNLEALPDPAIAFLDATARRANAYASQGLSSKELARVPVELYTLSPSYSHLFPRYGADRKPPTGKAESYQTLYFMSEAVVRIAAETGVYLSNLLAEITRDELPAERGTVLGPGATVLERETSLS